MDDHRSIEEIIRNSYDFRIYTPRELETVVKNISTYFSLFPEKTTGKVIEPELLVFRNRKEQYWIVDPTREQWFLFTENGWELNDKPAEPLEGSAYLCVYLSEMEDPVLTFNTDEKDINAVDTSPSPEEVKRSLRKLIAQTFDVYLSGKLTSSSTESFLQQYIIADKNASLWTIGCHSGNWYCFTKDHWESYDTEPENDCLPPSKDLEQLYGKLNQTLELLSVNEPSILPEPVVLPWRPPTPLPPSITKPLTSCGACGHVLTDSAQFCPQCGRSRIQKKKLFCSACGRELEVGARFCIGCGLAVSTQKVSQAKTRETLCHNCDAVVYSDQKFCASCGSKIIDKSVTPTCPGCGVEISEGLKFCTNCGEKL